VGGRVRHPCVSTRYAPQTTPRAARPLGGARLLDAHDPAEQVALVARAKHAGLLRAHRHRLRAEDLEDCLSQAVLELLAAARGGQRFAGRAHVEHTLEQRFLSRVHDRRRALGGRSPVQAALEGALPLSGPGEHELELADPRADVHALVAHRLQLRCVRELAPRLTDDQRLVLACQVALGMDRAEFCERFGWSFEKYRKVAQRARGRLRGLLEAEPVQCPASRAGSE
jgi:DNA-directed RNA polymerase specialized sigma24 family protein